MGALGRWAAGLALVAAACAPPVETPQELRSARDAYSEASRGPAATQAPSMLVEARVALEQAEAAFRDRGNTQEVRDKAYVAQRKAETATMIAMAIHYEKRAEDARVAQAMLVDRTTRELQAVHDRLKAQDMAVIQAEARANAALESLQSTAHVSQQERGLVIRIGVGDLFEPGATILSEDGAGTLAKVTELLRATPDRRARIEGYTDTRGPSEQNRILSAAQADAVRDYLATHGVGVERLSAVGKGEQSPVAPNRTEAGRAENRRVEIVVTPLTVQE